MKICKNNFDIALYSVSYCNICAFNSSMSNCYWFSLFKKYSLKCGGTTVERISDIFRL